MPASVERAVRRLVQGVAVLSGFGLLFAVLVTCVSILGKLGRRLLNAALGADFDPAWLTWVRPVLGEEELVQFAVGFALYGALPWVTFNCGHIRIDLFKGWFGRRANQLLDLLGSAAIAAIAYLLLTRQWYLVFVRPGSGEPGPLAVLAAGEWRQFAALIRMRDETQILALPLWPLHAAAELCALVFLVAAVYCVARHSAALLAGRPCSACDG